MQLPPILIILINIVVANTVSGVYKILNETRDDRRRRLARVSYFFFSIRPYLDKLAPKINVAKYLSHTDRRYSEQVVMDENSCMSRTTGSL